MAKVSFLIIHGGLNGIDNEMEELQSGLGNI